MPEIKFLDPSRGIAPQDWIAVWAIMLHPKDENLRREFIKVSSAACLSEANGPSGALLRSTLRMDEHAFAEIATLPSVSTVMKRAVDAAGFAGHTAGDILLYVLAAASDRPADATLRKARYLLERRNAGDKSRRGKVRPASPAAIKAAWGAYRSVAHFYAAINLQRQRNDLPLTYFEDMPMLLTGAECLRRRGEAFKPPGSATPVLRPDETWRIPQNLKLPVVDIVLEGIDEWSTTRLEEYRHD